MKLSGENAKFATHQITLEKVSHFETDRKNGEREAWGDNPNSRYRK